MKIFLTGSSGFIGKYLLEQLNKLFFCTKIYVIQEPHIRSDKIVFLPGYCRESHKFIFRYEETLFKTHLNEVDFVIHLGGHSNPNIPYDKRNKVWGSNVEFTRKLLDGCENNQQFIFISSINANDTNSFYGLTKHISEELVNLYTAEKIIKGINLRLCAVGGPALTHGAIHSMIKEAKAQDVIHGYGNEPGNVKPYIHVSDVCNLIIECLGSGKTGTYTVGTSDNISTLDIINLIQNQLGTHKPVEWVPQKPEYIALKQSELNITRDMFRWYKTYISSADVVRQTIKENI